MTTAWMPEGWDLDDLFRYAGPGPGGVEDVDPPDPRTFDGLESAANAHDLERLNRWIDAQAVCTWLIKHYGDAGLAHVVAQIAKASAAKRVPMSGRVRSAAAFMGLEVV